MKHPLRLVGSEPDPVRSRRQDVERIAASVSRPLELDPPDHVQLRGNRRVLVEALQQAVRDRDAGAMQLAIHRLSRLGVKRDLIEQKVREAQA